MVTVRKAAITDAQRILEIYDYYVKNTAITFEYDSPSIGEFRNRMERTMRRYPYLVVEKDNVLQGYAYAGAFVGRAAYDCVCQQESCAKGLEKVKHPQHQIGWMKTGRPGRTVKPMRTV